jgi:hypothetical protein
MTNIVVEAVLCGCGNLFKVEEISQHVTLRFLCDPCPLDLYTTIEKDVGSLERLVLPGILSLDGRNWHPVALVALCLILLCKQQLQG